MLSIIGKLMDDWRIMELWGYLVLCPSGWTHLAGRIIERIYCKFVYVNTSSTR